MIFAISFAIFWFASMIWSCGETFAFYQRRFPSNRKDWFYKDAAFAWSTAILGPANSIILRVTHGPKLQGGLWPLSKTAKREAGLL